MNKRQHQNGEILVAFYGKSSHPFEYGTETDAVQDERLYELRVAGFSDNYRAHFSAEKMLDLGYQGGNHGVLIRLFYESRFGTTPGVKPENIKAKIGLILDSFVFPEYGRYYRMLFDENNIVWLHGTALTKITTRMKKKMIVASKKSR